MDEVLRKAGAGQVVEPLHKVAAAVAALGADGRHRDFLRIVTVHVLHGLAQKAGVPVLGSGRVPGGRGSFAQRIHHAVQAGFYAQCRVFFAVFNQHFYVYRQLPAQGAVFLYMGRHFHAAVRQRGQKAAVGLAVRRLQQREAEQDVVIAERPGPRCRDGVDLPGQNHCHIAGVQGNRCPVNGDAAAAGFAVNQLHFLVVVQGIGRDKRRDDTAVDGKREGFAAVDFYLLPIGQNGRVWGQIGHRRHLVCKNIGFCYKYKTFMDEMQGKS